MHDSLQPKTAFGPAIKNSQLITCASLGEEWPSPYLQFYFSPGLARPWEASAFPEKAEKLHAWASAPATFPQRINKGESPGTIKVCPTQFPEG